MSLIKHMENGKSGKTEWTKKGTTDNLGKDFEEVRVVIDKVTSQSLQTYLVEC